MSLVHTGKLLIRFIKDFSSIIMEPQQIPKPVINKDFYMWFGAFPKDDKKLKVKLNEILPALPKFEKSHNTKIWNDEVWAKEKEKIQHGLRKEQQGLRKGERATRPCEIFEGKGTWKKNETPLWWYP